MSSRIPPLRYLLLAALTTGLVVLFSLSSPAQSLRSQLSGVSTTVAETWYKGIPLAGSSKLKESIDTSRRLSDGTSGVGGVDNSRRANATFIILCRNSDLWETVASIRQLEDRFNHEYNYPYTFLNDEPFSEEFILHTSSIVSGKTEYGVTGKGEWGMPDWVDRKVAEEKMQEMGKLNIPYAGSENYRKMCRYQAGFFWRHPLLDKYEYYWRVEPSVKFFCNVNYDPFLLMSHKKMKYSFTISIKEYEPTIPSLFKETKKFIEANPTSLAKPNSMEWISNDGGETYNLCHFWSNFEIASLDLWRSEAYRAYFDHLDKSGGFFYERWGDAPVHSIAAALFLKPEEIHFFQDIGYRHEPFQQCPKDMPTQCACNPNESFEEHDYSCTPQFKRLSSFGAHT